MERECLYIPSDELDKRFDIRYLFDKCKVEVYIDKQNFEEILKILLEKEAKARKAFYYILRCQYEQDSYGKENIDEKTANITAIKFKVKSNQNIRIFCREYFE